MSYADKGRLHDVVGGESHLYYLRNQTTKEIHGKPFEDYDAAKVEAIDVVESREAQGEFRITLEVVRVGTATISVDVYAVIEQGATDGL